jgi:hypothetical protein
MALKPEKRAELTSCKAVVSVAQKEIGAAIVESNSQTMVGSQFGALGSLVAGVIDVSVNSSRAKKAEATIAPVRDALLDYDVGAKVSAALQGELAKMSWAKGAAFEVQRVAADKQLATWVAQCGTDTLLSIQTDYRLTPSFDALMVSLYVSLHPRTSPANKDAKTIGKLPPALYANTFAVTQAPGRGGLYGTTPAEWATFWATDGGRPAKETLDRAIREAARLVAYDLEQPERPKNGLYKATAGESSRTVTPSSFDVAATPVLQGYVERAEDDRAWVRLPAGSLISVMR